MGMHSQRFFLINLVALFTAIANIECSDHHNEIVQLSQSVKNLFGDQSKASIYVGTEFINGAYKETWFVDSQWQEVLQSRRQLNVPLLVVFGATCFLSMMNVLAHEQTKHNINLGMYANNIPQRIKLNLNSESFSPYTKEEKVSYIMLLVSAYGFVDSLVDYHKTTGLERKIKQALAQGKLKTKSYN